MVINHYYHRISFSIVNQSHSTLISTKNLHNSGLFFTIIFHVGVKETWDSPLIEQASSLTPIKSKQTLKTQWLGWFHNWHFYRVSIEMIKKNTISIIGFKSSVVKKNLILINYNNGLFFFFVKGYSTVYCCSFGSQCIVKKLIVHILCA